MNPLFISSCIPARLALATGVYLTPDKYMKYLIVPAVGSALLITYKYFEYGWLKSENKTQLSFFKKPVWFNCNRVFHFLIIILLIFCIYTKDYNHAKMLLFIDLLGGIIMTFSHYCS